jgi:hypothetical protein
MLQALGEFMSSRLSTSFVLSLLIVASVQEARAESLLNLHASVGLGFRYGGWTFPFPHLNANTQLGNGVLFVEGSASVLAFLGSVGYEYKLSDRNSAYLARTIGFTLESDFSGYKVGYSYNSNGFNQSGWVTSIEVYSFVQALIAPNSNNYFEENFNIMPSISFGYQW